MKLLFDTPPLTRTLPWIADYTSTILYAGVSAQLFRWDARRRRLVNGACIRVLADALFCKYAFVIDPALRWQDGKPVSARDYVDSLGYALDAATPVSGRLAGITGMAARPGRRGADEVLEIRLAHPDRQLCAKLAHPAFGPRRAAAHAPYPDAAGPFMLSRLDDNGGRLQARHAAAPGIDLCFVADPEEALERYLAGDVDATCAASFPLRRLAQLSTRADFQRCDSTTFFALVATSPRGQDYALKRRMQQLIDLPALAAVCPGGLSVCTGFAAMRDASPACAAVQRTAAAPGGVTGITIAYDDFDPNHDVASRLAAQLAAGGLRAALVADDYAQPGARADFKLAVLVNSEGYPADLYRRLLQAPELARDSLARAAWHAALDAFDAADADDARAGALASLDRLLAAWLPVIPLVRLNQFCLKRPSLRWFEWNCERAWLRA